MAGWHSTVMLCYATPKEYLSLADAGDVSKSLIAYTIAADGAPPSVSGRMPVIGTKS